MRYGEAAPFEVNGHELVLLTDDQQANRWHAP
jgi:hypothetical protein